MGNSRRNLPLPLLKPKLQWAAGVSEHVTCHTTQTTHVKMTGKQHLSYVSSGSSNPEDLLFETNFDTQCKQIMMTAGLEQSTSYR